MGGWRNQAHMITGKQTIPVEGMISDGISMFPQHLNLNLPKPLALTHYKRTEKLNDIQTG